MSRFLNRTINDLVAENHVRASVLYYFGVKFYDYQTSTLEEVCANHGLKAENVINALDLVNDASENTLVQLRELPVSLLIEYLRHAHFLFVKKRLPYLGQLIDGLADVNFRYKALSDDLKSIFPLFVEDFIHHIYEEEDTVFSYVHQLLTFIKTGNEASKALYAMKRFSISDFALDHEVHEHEMEGFRQITNDYRYCEEADLHIKVLYSELERFERDLLIHAKVENDILFPKTLELENRVKLKFEQLAKLN